MTKKIKIIFLSILFIQALIIISLLLYISNKQNNVISISPLKKENFTFSNQNSLNLKSFYELGLDKVRIDKPDWLPYIATYTINKDGLNERFDYPTEKAPDAYRIITLGDSNTFGADVNTPDNWPEKLEDLFQTTSFCKDKKIEVINLGVPGYDIEYAVARLKLRGIKYNPDMVLWLVQSGDFTDNNELMRPTINKYKKEFDAEGSITTKEYFPWLKKAVKEIQDKVGVNAIVNRQIEVMKSITEIYKNMLVLITVPQTTKRYKDILTNFANSRPQTHFFDNLLNFYAPSKHVLLPDGHPSVEGHRLIASSIYNYLKVNKLIPCR